jgi:hypothetical protein
MRRTTREILAAWAFCGLVGLGALALASSGGPAAAVDGGVRIPGQTRPAASGLSIADEFGDVADSIADARSVSPLPSAYGGQQLAESQRCRLVQSIRRWL